MRIRQEVKCNVCGVTHYTVFFEKGQIHKNCGGEFIPTGNTKESVIFK